MAGPIVGFDQRDIFKQMPPEFLRLPVYTSEQMVRTLHGLYVTVFYAIDNCLVNTRLSQIQANFAISKNS